MSGPLPTVLLRHFLLEALEARGYHFVTPTPATHARVVARRSEARDLRDVFGWSLPFAPGLLDEELVALLRDAGALEERGPLLASRVRASRLGENLVLHSAYPTVAADAVFFGPDTYRFAAFLDAALPRLPVRQHIVDIGTGSGAGALVAARHARMAEMSLTDINAQALAFARANALHASGYGRVGAAESWRFIECDGLAGVDRPFDTVIANPPYIVDAAKRAYRDGGALHGAEISLRWAREAAARLPSGGALLLYTGSAIVDGVDSFNAEAFALLDGFDVSYCEIDPDVFGEELERADYADVERIAVVGLVAVKH